MSALLLDTNIVIYAINKVRYYEQYRRRLDGRIAAISIITVGELYEGVFRAGLGSRTHRNIVAGLDQYVVLPLNENVCRLFGKIRFESRNKPISVPDALIAATALAYDLPLVTHNPKDFIGIEGLNVITEYQ
ncbi:MAG: PIN domain-containing protein [Planctomycetaceae bacterium]|jgi:predicted nucleic acid-binding protein|nr:PIN domain-containing protein [Planctomycetaceae bacterium]